MGQAVEDMVKKLYSDKTMAEVDTKYIDYRNRHKSYHDLTAKTLTQDPDVVYQAGFVTDDNLFVKTDFLVKNES